MTCNFVCVCVCVWYALVFRCGDLYHIGDKVLHRYRLCKFKFSPTNYFNH